MKILRYPMVHDTNYDLAYRRCPRRSMDVRRPASQQLQNSWWIERMNSLGVDTCGYLFLS